MLPYNLQLQELLVENATKPSPKEDEKCLDIFPFLKLSERGFYFEAEGLASFFISAERKIHNKVYKRTATYQDYLHNMVTALHLLQKSFLLLHGNSFIFKDQHIAICGESRAGKSSLAAQFHSQGALFFCDEIICFNQKNTALPGYPFLRLWENDIVYNQFDPNLITQLWDNEDKFKLNTSNQNFCEERKVDILVYLDTDEKINTPEIKEIKGIEKVKTFWASYYHPKVIDAMNLTSAFNQQSLDIIKQIKIFKLIRPNNHESKKDCLELLKQVL